MHKTTMILALLAASTPAMAVQFADVIAVRKYQIEMEPLASPAELTDVAWGDVDGDLSIDLFYTQGNVLKAMFAPGLFDAFVPTSIDANSVEALPWGGVDVPTCLAVTGSAGLSIVSLDPVTDQWVNQVIATTGWDQVTELRSFASPTGVVLMGLDTSVATSHKLRFLFTLDTEITASSVWLPFSDVDLGHVCSGMEMLNWDGAGWPEIAVAIEDTVGGVDASTVAVQAMPWTNQPPLWIQSFVDWKETKLERIESIHSTGDCLAGIMTGVANPNAKVFGVLSQAQGVTNTINMTGFGGVKYLRTDDFDNDGVDDVILTRTLDYRVGILLGGDAATPEYTVSTVIDSQNQHPWAFMYDTLIPGSAALAGMVGIFDLDSDGDNDVLTHNPEDNQLLVTKNEEQENSAFYKPLLVEDATTFPFISRDGELNFTMSCQTLASNQRLECLAWEQLSFGPNDTMESIPIYHKWFEEGTAKDILVDMMGTTYGFDEVVYGMARIVEVDANKITKIYPACCLVFSGLGQPSVQNDYVTKMDPYIYQFQIDAVPGVVREDDPTGREIPCLLNTPVFPPKADIPGVAPGA